MRKKKKKAGMYKVESDFDFFPTPLFDFFPKGIYKYIYRPLFGFDFFPPLPGGGKLNFIHPWIQRRRLLQFEDIRITTDT